MAGVDTEEFLSTSELLWPDTRLRGRRPLTQQITSRVHFVAVFQCRKLKKKVQK